MSSFELPSVSKFIPVNINIFVNKNTQYYEK